MVSSRGAAVVAVLALGAAAVAGCAGDDEIVLSEVAPEVGECFLAPEPDDAAFTVVACDEQHQGEVVGRVDLATYESPAERPEQLRIDATSDERPDDGPLQLAATDACTAPFEEYVGVAYTSSRYTLQPIAPTSASWADGDRDVVCVVVKLTAPLGEQGSAIPGTMTSSVRGAAE